MSKYEELLKEVADAESSVSQAIKDRKDWSAVLKRRGNAYDARYAYERAAAGLIERARDELGKSLSLCSYQGEYDNCSDCSLAGGQCEAKKLLDEMEALTK